MKKVILCILLCAFVCSTLYGCEPQTPQQDKAPLSLRMPEDGELRIAQFADLHFGIEGENYHNSDEVRTIQFMDYVVETTQPDFIVCSGDNVMSSGVEGIKEFVSVMDKYQIPWTIIWGNHDTTPGSWGYSKQDISNYLTNCGSSYLVYQEDYIEKGSEDRYGNFAVSVYDSHGEQLLGAILLMDSGTYDYELEGYQSITSGQIQWYRDKIATLQERYAGQESNAHSMIPSILFAHIPLPEHGEAYEKAVAGAGAEFVIHQNVSDRFISAVKNSGPLVNTHFYDTLKEVGSTRAYLVGHMHGLSYQVMSDGILLGFGPQTGFSKMGNNSMSKRTTYTYCLQEDFTFSTITCTEP